MWKQLSFLSNEHTNASFIALWITACQSLGETFFSNSYRSIYNFTLLPQPSAPKYDISEKRVLKCTHASETLEFWLEYVSALGKHKLTLLGTVMLNGVHWRLGTHFPSSLSETQKNFKWHLKIFNVRYHVFMEDLWNTSTFLSAVPTL